MEQTVEERKRHHSTREDRQRKVYDQLQERIRPLKANGRLAGALRPKLAVYERDAANLARKLNLSSS